MTVEFVDVADIYVSEDDRQRQTMDSKKLEELANSIEVFGLIHPILVIPIEDSGNSRNSENSVSPKYKLIAGFRRFTALKHLAERGVESYRFACEDIPISKIPVVIDEAADKIKEKELELEENIRRVNLTWQEEAQAIATLHELRKAQNPEHKIEDTAREAQTIRPSLSRKTAAKALVVSKALDDPDIRRSPSIKVAYDKLMKKARREIEAALIKKAEPKAGYKLHEHDFRHAKFEPESFDCILADPPYGIGAEKFARASLAHQYDDSNTEVARDIISLASKILKDKGVLFLFCDIDYFLELREYAKSMLEVRRTPLIWYHPHVGHDASGRGRGFRRNSELILCAWKGIPSFKGIIDDVITVPHVVGSERVHPAQKPVELYKTLLNSCCTVGAKVLDPCCGVGTIFKAARELKLEAEGCESSAHYAPIARLAAKQE